MAIVVRRERIEAVVPAAQLEVPTGAEIVDVKDQFA
jgi:imidazolonepropionase-like amidohydrolase